MYMTIKYEVQFSPDAVATAANRLREAIGENWATFHQSWGMDQAVSPDWENWLRDMTPDRMMRVDPEDDVDEGDGEEFLGESNWILFSPASSWVGHFSIFRSKKGLLGLKFRTDADARYLDYEFSGKFPPEYLWKINRQCLFHIFQCLKSVFPVKASIIDDEFFCGPTDDPA